MIKNNVDSMLVNLNIIKEIISNNNFVQKKFGSKVNEIASRIYLADSIFKRNGRRKRSVMVVALGAFAGLGIFNFAFFADLKISMNRLNEKVAKMDNLQVIMKTREDLISEIKDNLEKQYKTI